MDLTLSRRICNCGSIFYFRAVEANVRQVYIHVCINLYHRINFQIIYFRLLHFIYLSMYESTKGSSALPFLAKHTLAESRSVLQILSFLKKKKRGRRMKFYDNIRPCHGNKAIQLFEKKIIFKHLNFFTFTCCSWSWRMTYINKVHCHSYVHVSTHRNVYIYSSIAFNSNSQTLLDKQRYLIQTLFYYCGNNKSTISSCSIRHISWVFTTKGRRNNELMPEYDQSDGIFQQSYIYILVVHIRSLIVRWFHVFNTRVHQFSSTEALSKYGIFGGGGLMEKGKP